MNFTIKCDECGSEDVIISANISESNDRVMDILAYCRNCENESEISG